MGRLWWVAVVATSGCSSIFGLGDPSPAPPDALATTCTVAGFDLCAHQQPNGPIAFNGDTTIDTTLDCNVVVFDPSGGSVCVIYATDITVGATIRAEGKRPLALAATGTIVVDGTVDVSSSAMKGLGAGGGDAECMVKRTSGARSGGGAGGSFGGKGGDGGTGTLDPGTSGLASDPIQLPDRLRGGCSGGGSSGGGGGGVALVASTSITIAATGRVLANGGGGSGGQSIVDGGFQIGAGGGGSGGLIRLAAPSIAVHGTLTANGGGGGEGGDNNMNGTSGMAGGDGTTSTTAALGGAGGGGGDGGGGTGGATVAGGTGISPMGTSLGAGGGGGGIGFIVLTGTADTAGGTISPPPM